ncbi:MAG: acetoacetate decarboxylase family protein [Sulfolobaceae archaeon]
MKGKLNINQIFAMPAHAPLYLKPPAYYRDFQAIIGIFKGNAEGISETIPDNLDLITLGDNKPLFMYYQAYYPFSSLYGSYNEVVIAPLVIYENQPHLFVSYIYVDNDAALTAGREIWGFPKKLAKMRLEIHGESIEAELERPAGRKLMSVQMRIERQAKMEELQAAGIGSSPVLLLKIIPNPDAESKPTAELVRVEVKITPRTSTSDNSLELWTGKILLNFIDESLTDPIFKFGPVEPISAYFGRFDMVLPPGKIVYKYI